MASVQHVRDLPYEIKQRLVMDADREQTNINAVIITILAETYGAEIEPRPTRRAPNSASSDGGSILIRFGDDDLHEHVQIAAVRHGWSTPREIRWALARYYGVDLADRPPKRADDPVRV